MAALGLGRRLQLILDIADKVVAEAERHGADFALVAVDRGGHEMLVYRSDLCSYNAIEPARRKAVTAAAMGIPTSIITGMSMPDPVMQRALTASPDMLAVPGGFPIMMDNVVVAGLGISGGHYSEDHMIVAKALVKEGHLPPAMLHMGPPPGPPGGSGAPPGGPPRPDEEGPFSPIPGGMPAGVVQ